MAETMPVCRAAPSSEERTQSQVSEAPLEDPERTRRVQEARRRNDKFWRDVFAETGVRRYRSHVEDSVWKQRLTIAAVAFVIIAGITQAIYRAYLDLNFGFRNIDVTDTERLKEVMFGGNPWIVLCRWPENKKCRAHVDTDGAGSIRKVRMHVSPLFYVPRKVPEILDNHRQELMKFGSLGSVDCSANLPSGTKFAERFRIPSSTEAMVITNGKAPRILNVWALKNWENLSSFLQRNTKIEVRSVEENISFTKNCLFPPGSRCIIFARKGGFTPETKHKVIAGTVGKKGKTRKLKVVTVDTGKYQVSGVDLGAKSFYATKVACIGNISPPPTPEAKKKKDVSKDTFISSIYQGEFTNSRTLLEFAESCISSKEGNTHFQYFVKGK
ncbi:conserved hypothetical protein [Neospora caninum Liverpool]|uniref:Transmembrane protein n=1 Tax=Neospora caninum (strain Liverpool) TaxID=572307 RepID=F0VLS9_NEOCL|nr:conserved hypothetical protein [Neospora caninum Liverpool]CBZ54207.1 conserved hypothetical protein [Neospora caninum Liverpool]|eukprot:XP_003884238.1 conserved hypothetical protein [Neospora caninum Liverpool]